jgi:hypothetical protein
MKAGDETSGAERKSPEGRDAFWRSVVDMWVAKTMEEAKQAARRGALNGSADTASPHRPVRPGV